jgi:hypothetical protein
MAPMDRKEEGQQIGGQAAERYGAAGLEILAR